MPHIVLFEPEIPPNTGNIIRLCANTGFELHLVEPLGFQLDAERVRRAGLDYHDMARVHRHASLHEYITQVQPARLLAVSTRAATVYSECRFQAGDSLLFGPETRGLPKEVLSNARPEHTLRIPMCSGNRSLNLSNAVALVAYEAWRQLGFDGAQTPTHG